MLADVSLKTSFQGLGFLTCWYKGGLHLDWSLWLGGIEGLCSDPTRKNGNGLYYAISRVHCIRWAHWQSALQFQGSDTPGGKSSWGCACCDMWKLVLLALQQDWWVSLIWWSMQQSFPKKCGGWCGSLQWQSSIAVSFTRCINTCNHKTPATPQPGTALVIWQFILV